MTSERPIAGAALAALVMIAGLACGAPSARAQGGLAEADLALGAYLAQGCSTCHQASGASDGAIPAINGHPSPVFEKEMLAFKARTRDNIVMQSIAETLTTNEIAALAVFYARQPQPH